MMLHSLKLVCEFYYGSFLGQVSSTIYEFLNFLKILCRTHINHVEFNGGNQVS